MSWGNVAAAAVAVVGTAIGLDSAKKSEKAAKKQAKEQARIEEELTAEKLFQLGLDERQMRGETLAGFAGGGVLSVMQGTAGTKEISGSPSTILEEQRKAFARERKITKSVGASNVAQTLMAGSALADRYKYEGYSSAAMNISSIISNLTKAFG